MKPSIAFVINSLAGGGAERSIVNLLQHSGDYATSYDFHLILLDDVPFAYEPPIGIEVHRLHAKGSLWRSVLQLRRCLAALKPSVVISSLTRSNLSNVLTAKLQGHTALICEHAHTSGHYAPGLRGVIAKSLIRLLYPRADKVISVSMDIENDLIDNFGVPASKALTLVNPIDTKAIRQLSCEASSTALDGKYFVGMGRLVDSKNFALMLRAYASSLFENDLVIMGTGPCAESLITLARELGVEHRVHFLGFVRNPYPILKHATAYVLSSNGEGLPTGIIEAMTLGVPIVSTNCRSGPYEILQDEAYRKIKGVKHAKYGLLVPPNSLEDLSEAMMRCEQDDTREQLAAVAVKGAERYELEAAVKKYWSLVEQFAPT